MPLQFTSNVIFKVDAYDLEKFVKSVYGQTLEFCQDQEASNDSEHLFTVNGTVDKWSQEILDDWQAKSNDDCWVTDHILNDLVKRKLIPAGEWLVILSW